MKWEEFFENIFNTEPNTLVEKIPSLESIGPSSEVIMALSAISLGCSSEAATSLLEKALQTDMIFTASEIYHIFCSCTQEGCKKAFYKSAHKFSTEDLEELYHAIEDEWIIDVAKKNNIELPKCFTEACEEEYEEWNEEEDVECEEIFIPIPKEVDAFNFVPKKRRSRRKGFSDEEILALGLYPQDEGYKMYLISKILAGK